MEEAKKLKHVNEIESPENLGKNVRVEALISSTSMVYSVPKKIEITADDGTQESIEIKPEDEINLRLINIESELRDKRIRQYCSSLGVLDGKKIASLLILESRAIYWVKIRPEIFFLHTSGTMIVDDAGYEYKSYDVYVAAERQISFHPSSSVLLTGRVLSNPRSQTLTHLSIDVQFPQDSHCLDLAKLGRLKEKLDSFANVEQRVDWVLRNFSAYSQIVNRSDLAFACLLCHFTPVLLNFDGELQRGWGNILVIGDSTTGKSETERKLIRLLEGGVYITAETASQVGLIGSAVQAERGGWYVDWGFLVLQHRKLLAIDGAHKLPMSHWGSLAESERTGVVTIAKAAKEQAQACTRQIKIANALDRDTWSTKSISSFLRYAQAVPSILDKVSIARLDLAVFAATDEVEPEAVNKIHSGKVDEDFLLLSEAQKWAWSPRVNVMFEEDALKRILQHATHLFEEYHSDDIPLVSIDMKYKLARLSAALAMMTLSTTDDFLSVLVKTEHVDKVVSFIEEEYSQAGLDALAKLAKEEVMNEDEAEEIIAGLSSVVGSKEIAEAILKYVATQGRVTRESLKAKFELAEKSELRPLLSYLQEKNLIKSGKGFSATLRLNRLWRLKFASFATVAPLEKDTPPAANNQSDTGDLQAKHGKSGKFGIFDNDTLEQYENHSSWGSLKMPKCQFCGFDGEKILGEINELESKLGSLLGTQPVLKEEATPRKAKKK